MGRRQEPLSERLGAQLEAVIERGFAEHVVLDRASPSEEVIERRINAIIDAARERVAPRGDPAPSEAEREAQKLGWVLDSIVENAPAMLFLKSATDLTIELWNKQAERISGVKAADILGKTGFESFPAAEMREFHERDRAVLAGRRLVVAEEHITSPAGEARWVCRRRRSRSSTRAASPATSSASRRTSPSGRSRPRSSVTPRTRQRPRTRRRQTSSPTSATSCARRSRSSSAPRRTAWRTPRIGCRRRSASGWR